MNCGGRRRATRRTAADITSPGRLVYTSLRDETRALQFQLGAQIFTPALIGLLIGGLLAAPFGAFVAKRVPARPLLILVSIVLILTSAYGIYTSIRG